MALSDKEVQDIADYARLALDQRELAAMRDYLNDAIGLLEPVLAYDLPDVEPTFHPIGDLANVMREDAVDPGRSLGLAAALGNAARTRDRSFLVPRILGEDGDQ